MQEQLREWFGPTGIGTIAVIVGALIEGTRRGLRWRKERKREREELAAKDAALVADVRAHRESAPDKRPFLVLTNHGTVDALEVRVTMDGQPLEAHELFSAWYPKGGSARLEPGEVRRFRGANVDMGQRVFDVRVDWTTAKNRTGSWSGVLHRP